MINTSHKVATEDEGTNSTQNCPSVYDTNIGSI